MEASKVNKLMNKKMKEFGDLAPFSDELQSGLELSSVFAKRSGNYFTPYTNNGDRLRLISQYRQLSNLRQKLEGATKEKAIQSRSSLRTYLKSSGIKVSNKNLAKFASKYKGKQKQDKWKEAELSDSEVARLIGIAKNNGVPSEEIYAVLELPASERQQALLNLLADYDIIANPSTAAIDEILGKRDPNGDYGTDLTDEEEDEFWDKMRKYYM